MEIVTFTLLCFTFLPPVELFEGTLKGFLQVTYTPQQMLSGTNRDVAL